MADIRYQFVSTGANAVLRDWQSLTSAAQRYAAEINKLQRAEGSVLYGGGGGGGLGAGAPMARRGGMGGGGSAARDAERNRAYLAKIRDKHFADEQRAEDRAAAKKVRTEEQALRRIERMRDAARSKELRETERSEKQRLAITERSRIAEAKRSAMARDSMAGSVFRGIGGLAMGLGAAAIGLTTAGVRDSLRVREQANRISINARKSGETFIDPTVLQKEFEGVAKKTPGIKAADVAEAVQGFVTVTGDIKTARGSAQTFATAASATGSNVQDIAKAAAAFREKFNITDDAQMKDVLASLIFQGKEGAFELSDAAALFPRLASSAHSFGVPSTAQGLKTLGGLTQLARGETGSAEVAATNVENMFTAFKAKSAMLDKDYDVNVYRGDKVKPIEELLVETISKVGGTDIAKKQAGLQKIFGDQGIRAVNPLIAKYNETFQNTKGTEKERIAAASAAVVKALDDATNAAGTWADVELDAAQAQKDTSAKATQAWEEFVSILTDKFVPALVPVLDDMITAFSKAGPTIGLFFQGLSAIVGFLRQVHLLDGPTDQERNDEAKAALKAYETTLPEGAMGPHSPAVEAKLKELRGAVDATNPFKPVVGANQESFTGFGQFRGALENGGLTPVGPGDAEERAQEVKNLYSAILSDPKGQMDLLKTDPTYMGGMLTDEGRNKALALASQTKEANDGQGVAPSANLYEAEKLAPVFAGLGTAAAQLQKTLEAAAAAGEANLLGGGAS